jgi:DNA repair protein SbcD/Mre11
MIKFLYSTDWHSKGKSPATRTDDFPTTIETKIKHFFELGHELGVDAFLAGGDYFDSPFTSSAYVTRIGKIIEEGTKDKKLYGIWGNHDVSAWNPDTVKNTSIGVFQSFSNSFIVLDRKPIIFEKNGQKVKLSGVSSYARLDRHELDEEGNIVKHRARDYVIEETDGTPQIHIVHGYLSPKAVLDDIAHTVINEMRHTKAAVTLTGHEHTGFPVTKIDNGFVYNPGALGRVFASHTEMNRMPNYALITIHTDGSPEVEPIQCSIAKKGTEVMDRSLLDAKKAKEALILAAKGNIGALLKQMNIEGVDLNHILSHYKKTTKPEVFEEAKRRLGF